MKELNLNFGKLYWEMFQDERLVDLSNDGIILYTKMLDKMNLSKSRKYVDSNGEVYILFTQDEALEKCRIKQRTFFTLKKQLKELGLIHYDEQKVKKAGVSTPIYVKHYETWSKEFINEVVETVEVSDNLNNNNYTQQPQDCEPIHKTIEENIEVPEVPEENSMDNTHIVLEESTKGPEDSNNGGFGIYNVNFQPSNIEPNELAQETPNTQIDRMKSPQELQEECNKVLELTKDILVPNEVEDRKMVFVKTNQFGQMVEVFRYVQGKKEDLIKSAEGQGFKLIDFLNKIEKHKGAIINYI
ncbi:replication initiator protein A [Neobacillus sp. MER 74]|uniref:replication initiator protein A n=1 Tax=Neobacillus sp. MER 74 TaxID=2939566 RepID=UPI00203A5D5B|nr:replication initiator protein A [Neobacillus sp. MER 74]MCM3115460.1 replication initiator protein A [Neobacillus sp. MER 74]